MHVDSVSTHAPKDSIVVEDAHLLFTGGFKRTGSDLVISKDGHEVVVPDYFRGEKRAPLASPDGAYLTGDLVNALAGHTQFAQADGSAGVAKVIGHVTKLTGSATVIRNGVSIVLNLGDNVNKGDVVQAGSNSTLGITFIDGGVFGLGSNAKMVLNEMIYDPNGTGNKSLLSLVQGTISFVAGATAKTGDMKVDTPVATMGIRGTAVLVEIDFVVPAQGGAPPAKFQVLVEPDGTTGSYILFDKTTLTPIATVNQAGTQTIINGQGTVSFLSSAPLSPDAQKVITDVFSLKFSDLNNPNTKLTTNFNDSIVPDSSLVKLAGGDFVPVQLKFIDVPDKPAASPGTGPSPRLEHIPGAPDAGASGGAFTELTNITASTTADSVSGKVNYIDINAGDVPSVKTAFSSFTYQNAQKVDVTATLTAEQLAAIKAVEVPLVVVQDPNAKNTGSATWTYNIADGAFDFLAAGETLKLTYMARVDNNYAPNNETTFVPFTIVVTGTNDKPTIATTGSAITERIGTGNTAVDVATGTVTFTDVDLTDRPVVSTAFSDFKYVDAEGNDVTATLTPEQLAAILAVEAPLTVVQTAGNTNNGTASWTYSVTDQAFDFLARGETLTLNYVAQVDDGHGGVVSTPISVSINGADIDVVGTNDVPTIATTSNAFAERSNETQPNPTGSTLFDTVSGTISFTDVDLTDRPVAHAAFTSFTYQNASLANVTSSLTAAQLAAIAAVEAPLSVVQAAGNTNNGSATWTYSVADKAFDFLADGEILTLTYTATVDDGHGGVVTKPITVTVLGSNDTPLITSDPQTAIISEKTDTHGSAMPDTASGAITFTDADLTDTHAANITIVYATGVTTGLLNGAVPSEWLSLGPLSDSTDGGQGSQSWSFSAPDSYFDYLADGEVVTLTYTVEVADHHGGFTSQNIVVTVNGSNDAPVIANIAQLNLVEQTDTAPLTAAIPVTFTDFDLSDIGHTAAVTHAVASGTTTGLALDEAALIALVTPGTVTKASGSSAGSVELDFSAASTAFDYLAAGQKLTLTYTVAIDDGDGGVTPQTFVVTVTGTNDAPSIVGEIDPPVQTVIVAAPAGPILLAPGTNDNLLGLISETFDSRPAGSNSNSGAGFGDFYSAALDATFSGSGNAGVVDGLFAPFATIQFGPLPATQDTTNYLVAGVSGKETITFTSEKNAFGLYWGTLDAQNEIDFYQGTNLVASYTGADLMPLFSSGNRGNLVSDGYVEFVGLPSFDKVVLGGGFFESDNISAGTVPAPETGLSGPIKGTLSVHDADIGDTLTAFVTGNATIEYNGLPSVPGGIDISALIDAADVKFDSAPSNGGTVVLNWTYQPINPNFDFLNAGDVLKIKFVAEVSDGHGHTGSQPLTVTLVGADSAANASTINATGPVIGTDVFSVTEKGDGTTTVSGLYVTDTDATASTDTFNVGAQAASPNGGVTPSTGEGPLALINTKLDSGITYDPGNDPPDTDMVTLTVSDGFGHADTVHFVFKQAEAGPVTLNGTSGKDVIFASGSDDTLTGGASADQFVFTPEQSPSADTITDFKPGEDHIDLRLFSEVVGADNINGWLAANAAQSSANPADVLITLGNDTLTLKNVAVTSLHASDFIVSPHHII